MTNQSDNRYEIKVVIRVDTSSYDGRAAYPVKKREAMILLKPAEVEEFAIQASYDEYADKLVGQADFKVNCLCQVINGDYEFWDTTNFRVKKPDIELELYGKATKGVVCRASARIANPLPVTLNKCNFFIDLPGALKPIKYKLKRSIGVNQQAQISFKFIPRSAGQSAIFAKFESKELNDVDGKLEFEVFEE